MSSSSTRLLGWVFAAKVARTFSYGFLGIAVPVYLTDLGLGATGVGVAVTATLAGSAVMTWLVRRPAERFGARVVLLALAGLSTLAATILLVARQPWAVIAAAVLGNVAVGTGETGPFLTVEQVLVARVTPPDRRTGILSLYNLLGYAAAAAGALGVGWWASYRPLFAVFLATAVLQLVLYAAMPAGPAVPRPAGASLSSAPLIRRLAMLFALDSFAGGFVLQSLVAYFLHTRFELSLEALGTVFAATQLLTGLSMLLAARAAARFGLLPTMVVSHFVSNALLIAIAFAPSAAAAVAFLLARHLLSQMDVPTRQAYVMAVVADHEREAAASLTNLSRTVAQAISPAFTGWVMHAIFLSAPFALGGALKMLYDALLWHTFKDIKLRD